MGPGSTRNRSIAGEHRTVSLPTVSKKLQQKQDRRRAEQRRRDAQRRASRRSNLITLAVVVAVALAVGLGILFERRGGEAQVPTDVGVSAGAANCSDLETAEALGRDHINEDDGVDYNTDPPTSGPHLETPAQPTFYGANQEVDPKSLVHNHEHGQIVIWYSPDAPEAVTDDLQAIQQQQESATVAAPYDGIEAPYNFALTAWVTDPEPQGVIQRCEQVSQEVVDDFRRSHQGFGPEPLTPRFEG